jgi:lipopolysaccharide transport system permease protein
MAASLPQRFARNAVAGLVEPFKILFTQRALLRLLIKRDIVNRTAGTLLGGLWMLAQPALQMLAFWFLLDFVLKVKFPGQVSFVNYFLIGMVPWVLIAEVLGRSMTVLSEFSALYRRSLFPLSILPVIPLILAALIYGTVFAITVAVLEGPAQALSAVGIIAALVVWLLPFCYFLAVIGLFVKDVAQVFPFVLTMLLYLTPILYMPEMLPEKLRAFLVFNPFADVMALIHAALQGLPFTAGQWLRPLLLWTLLLAPAWALFRRTEPHMREAL